MLNLGFWELIAILVLAFVVIGPKDMPAAARSFLRFFYQMKGLAKTLTDPIHEIKKNVEMQVSEAEKETALESTEKQPQDLLSKQVVAPPKDLTKAKDNNQ